MTSIEWTDETWNPTVGCSRVSAGCEHCYAEGVAHRQMSPQHRGLTVVGKHGPRWNGTVRVVESALAKPLSWKDRAPKLGRPMRIFVNSMSDLFHEELTFEQIADVFAVMAAAPQHVFQVLTKRPERMREWAGWATRNDDDALRDAVDRLCGRQQWCHANEDSVELPLANVWLGVSVEDQATADERIPLLLDTPAAVRFVSYEPALGPVDFTIAAFNGADSIESLEGLDWIIVGGESGPGARPFDLAWARSTIEQCRTAGVPCFVKQLGTGARLHTALGRGHHIYDRTLEQAVCIQARKGGDPSEWPADLRVRDFPIARSA